MRIFVSHKFRGVDPDALRLDLKNISNKLEAIGHSTFIYFRDVEQWGVMDFPPGKVIKEAFEEIKNSDAVLVLLNHKEPSEGMLLEFGFAKALGKKIILLADNARCPTFLEKISDEVIKFKNLEDAAIGLKNIKK